MKDSVVRALRTFIQAFLAFLIGSGILQVQGNTATLDWSILSTLGFSAAGAGLTSVVALVQNTLEDKKIIGQIIPK